MTQVSSDLIYSQLEEPSLKKMFNLLENDHEVQGCLHMSNVMTVNRLKYNDHGAVHSRITAGSSLAIFDLLTGKVERNTEQNGISMVDARIIVLCGAYLHDIGNSVHRVDHEIHGCIIARPHFANAMIERGYVPDFRAAFDRYLKDAGPAYVVVERTAPAEAVAAIHAAGGTATIAHPRQIALEDDDAWNAFFGELVDAGLAGIEVYHPSHKRDHRAYFGALADRLGLVRTGGSDFHGANKARIRIGTGNGTIDIRYDTWERLRERRTEPRAT